MSKMRRYRRTTKRFYQKDKNRQLIAKKVRIYPNSDLMLYISKSCGTRRFIYNYLLGHNKTEHKRLVLNINDAYENYVYYNESIPDSMNLEEEYEDVSSKHFNTLINELKKKEGYEWIGETNSKVIQQAINDLITAFKNFFNGTSEYPKFKKKNVNEDSCRFIDQAINGGQSKTKTGIKKGCSCIKGNRLSINGLLNDILFRTSHNYERYLNKYQSLIHNITLSKTKTKKYFASILIEDMNDYGSDDTGSATGGDLGIKDFFIDSNGVRYENEHWLKKKEKKLKREHRRLSRKVKDSKNFEKQRVKLARVYEKITNQRTNHHQKLSTELVASNKLICLETLNVKGMMKNHCLAKAVQEVSWFSFISMLKYKAARYDDKFVIQIDRWFASSKTCPICGHVHKELKLSDRVWTCPDCGTTHDRDLNAAHNILAEGLRIFNEQMNH